ncbi:unnamed protein product [Chondrus crispus]|uniref:EamA domain-containing protein n=1 Tax=Chondrus crispus TaxID=2769 RepID=R7QDD5_CHOCR|nr:unnamed protein product [Chondrus crispus]CDF36502.1 unnamed protein product [Chondrus crispus]|eukprot:XP_005716321.1 unnamed protein product [Chondrus crispus]
MSPPSTLPLPLVSSPNPPDSKATWETTPLLPPVEDPEPSSELTGYILMALSTLGYSGMSFFTHVGESKYGFSPVSSIFIRSVLHTFLTVLYLLCLVDIPQMFARFTRRQLFLLLARGVIGTIGMLCVYISLSKLPVGDAISIFFCYPVITMLLSGVFLGETITRMDGLTALISFTGIILIARPGFNDPESLISHTDRFIGSFTAVAGAFSASIAYVIVRGLGKSIHYVTSVLSLSSLCLLASVLLGGSIGPAGMQENKKGVMCITLAAFFAFAGQMCLNKGLQHCRAGRGALIRNVDVPVLYILGLLFLGEKITWFSLLGTCCVLTATAVIGLRAIRAAR